MAEREIVIARRSGAVTGPDGERVLIRAGRTIADADHPIVARYPRAWATVNVALRTDETGAEPGSDVPQDSKQAEYQEHALEFRRLASLLRGLNALPDQPLTAAEVVDRVAAIVDEWQNGGHAANDDSQVVPNSDLDRETVRAWAKDAGLAVADKGRLAAAVYDAYRAAN